MIGRYGRSHEGEDGGAGRESYYRYFYAQMKDEKILLADEKAGQ